MDNKDNEYKKPYGKILLMSLLGGICLLVLFALSNYLGGFVIASLASTAFIVFAYPKADSSRVRFVVGGYGASSTIGLAAKLIFACLSAGGFEFFNGSLILYFFVFVLTMFVMSTFDLQHPPAVAYALSIASGEKAVLMVAISMLSVSILCLLRNIMDKRLSS